MPQELQRIRLLLLRVVRPINLLPVGRSEAGFGCVANLLAAGRPEGDAFALAGGKLGLVGNLMLAKRSFSEPGLDFLGAVTGRAFSCPDL
jgi:hypothetical protein